METTKGTQRMDKKTSGCHPPGGLEAGGVFRLLTHPKGLLVDSRKAAREPASA